MGEARLGDLNLRCVAKLLTLHFQNQEGHRR